MRPPHPSRDPVAARLRPVGVVLAIPFLFPMPRAQEPPRYTLESTLRYYERHRDADEGRRGHPVSQLGGYDSPEVTRILLEEVARAETPSFKRTAVRALGSKPREGAVTALRRVLDDAGADFVLRNHAAAGLAVQGEAGVALLVERLEALPTKGRDRTQQSVYRSLVSGLGHASSDRAQAVLAASARTGEVQDRLAALRALGAASATASLTVLRLEASNHGDLSLATEAIRQLAVHGQSNVRARLLQLHKKARQSDDGRVHAALVEALAVQLDDGTYAAFLEHAAFVDPDVDETLARVAGRAARDAALATWLRTEALRVAAPRQRAVAIRLLAEVEDDAVTGALLPLLKASEPVVFRSAIGILAARGAGAAVPALRDLAQKGAPAQRSAAMAGLHRLLRDDPTWRAELLEALGSKVPIQRMQAMDLLADLEALEALPTVRRALDHADWPMRAAAYAFCARVRHTDSIPLLIDRLDAERDRLVDDVLDALQALTRLRFQSAARWRRWWAEAGDGFELPPPPERGSRRTSGANTAVTYYDLPVTSKRVVFVLDTSGSMSLPFGTAFLPRLSEAQRQLHEVVTRSPADFRFNLVFFGTDVNAVWRKLTSADDTARKKAHAAIDAHKAGGGTNIYDALAKAFEDPDVDTIYLLSDGYPSAGRIRDPQALAEEVAGWNVVRRIRIHAIAVGARSPLLEQLAGDSGGQYVPVRG